MAGPWLGDPGGRMGTVPAMMLDPQEFTPVPWANGAGTTRELAAASDPSGQLSWRVSVADLLDSAPFSSLPGLDRIFLPLGPVRLTIDGDSVDVGAGEQVRFSGEAAVAVALRRPTRALNVMTARNEWSAEVTLRPRTVPAVGRPTLCVDLGDHVADISLALRAVPT